MPYNRYHTDLMIASNYGLLKDEQLERIPSSTRHSWKKRRTGEIMGLNDELLPPDFEEMARSIATERSFRTMAKGLYVVNRLMKRMLEASKEKKALIGSQRDKIVEVIKMYGEKVGRKQLLRWFGVTHQQLNYWKSTRTPCCLSPISLCKKRFSNQLLPGEVKRIRLYLKDPTLLHWPGISIYYKMLREGALSCSKSVFYKYMKQLNVHRPGPRKDKSLKKGIRASRPFEVLHMDCSVFRPLDHSKGYIHMVVDNFSRAVLAHTVSRERSAQAALWNLRKALKEAAAYGYRDRTTLIVDDGSENKAEVEEATMDIRTLRKLIAQKDIRFSNSMVERIFRKIKYEGLYHRRIEDLEQTETAVDEDVNDYMNRPHGSLKGATPQEVLQTGRVGITPLISVEEARKDRIEKNILGGCRSC